MSMFNDPRWSDDPRDLDDDPRDRDPRDRDDDGWPRLGSGGSTRDDEHNTDSWRRDDERSLFADPREHDPRDAFDRGLRLPRGPEREVVYDPRDRAYTLRGSESRTLATVGAFRVVSAGDLRDHLGRSADTRSSDLRHLREQGLIDTVRVDGRRDVAVVLTDRGLELLAHHRRDRAGDQEPHQECYAGLRRERELEHDVQVYEAYLSVMERLDARDVEIERVCLDYELKRDYQEWLHERDRDGSG